MIASKTADDSNSSLVLLKQASMDYICTTWYSPGIAM